MAALDMYVERGQWEKCVETASKQVRLAHSIASDNSSIRGQTMPHQSRWSVPPEGLMTTFALHRHLATVPIHAFQMLA